MSVDQQRVRRTRTGLIAHDPARALQGYTLFAPMFGDGTVYLVDMDGTTVHTWRLRYRPGAYGYLLDDGHLFYSGKVMEDLERFEAWPRFKAGAALEVDWNGKVLWEVKHPDHHHDARKLRNGNVILLCLRPMPAALRVRVQGGRAGSEAHDGTIYADYRLEVTTEGKVVWEWRSWEHLDFDTAHNLDECREYFGRIQSPALGWAFTVNHAHLVPEGIDGFLDAMDLGRCGEVRLADSHGRWEEHLKPGQGTIDFARMFKRLEGGGYRGHYMMAFGSLDDMLAGREHLVKTCA